MHCNLQIFYHKWISNNFNQTYIKFQFIWSRYFEATPKKLSLSGDTILRFNEFNVRNAKARILVILKFISRMHLNFIS